MFTWKENLFDAAIRQCDVNLLHLHVHLEGETLSLSAVFHAVKARQTNREHVGVKYSLGLNQRDSRKPGKVRLRRDQLRLVRLSRRIDNGIRHRQL